jgi:hypothetical protein
MCATASHHTASLTCGLDPCTGSVNSEIKAVPLFTRAPAGIPPCRGGIYGGAEQLYLSKDIGNATGI